MNRNLAGLIWLFCALLTACSEDEPRVVGLLASDRVELVAEVAEPITSIQVSEGQQLLAGQIVLQQDTRRIEAQLTEAQANLGRVEARLAEQLRGPRQERIDAARAAVRSDEVELNFREKEWQRQLTLNQRNLGTQEALDQTRVQLDLVEARLAANHAQLAELEAGTTREELEQTRQEIVQLQAGIARLELELERHAVISPVDARVDSLPFETGEQPARGAVVAVLLTGNHAHARVYVPENIRVHVQVGDPVSVRVDGLAAPLSGTVRRIETDPAFTPYFSLTERDRGRLSYVAEITLPESEDRLPDGVPVEAVFDLPANLP